MLGYTQVDPTASGITTRYEPTWSETLSAAWKSGQQGSMNAGAMDLVTEQQIKELAGKGEMGSMLSVEDLSQKYAFPGLTWSKPEYEGVAIHKYNQQKDAIQAAIVLDQPSKKHLFWNFELPTSLKGSAALATSMLGSLVQPLDAAMMLAPMVGGARVAGAVGAGLRRKSVLRILTDAGLMSPEVAAVGAKVAQVGARMTKNGLIPARALPYAETSLGHFIWNNVAVAGMMETPHVLKDLQDTGEIEVGKTFKSMASNVAFAAAIHGAFMGLRLVGKATLDRMEHKALSDMTDSRNVDVSDIYKTDPNVVRADVEKVLFKKTEEQIRAEKTTVERVKQLYESAKGELEKAVEERKKANLASEGSHQITEREAERAARASVLKEVEDIYVQAEARVRSTGSIATVTPRGAFAVAQEYLKQDREALDDRGKKKYYALALEVAAVRDEYPTPSQGSKIGRMLGLDVSLNSPDVSMAERPGQRVFVGKEAGPVSPQMIWKNLKYTGEQAQGIAKSIRAFQDLVHQEATAELDRRVGERFSKMKATTDAAIKRVADEQEAAALREADALSSLRELEDQYQELLDQNLGKQVEKPRTWKETQEHVKSLNTELEKQLGELRPHEKAELDALEEHFLKDDAANGVMESVSDCIISKWFNA